MIRNISTRTITVGKRIILFLAILLSGSLCFAEQSFIDTPVIDIIEYFSKMSGYFMTIAFNLGKVLALVGFIWSCLMMVMRRKQAADVILGTMMKWMFFFLIMSLYPGFCLGLRKIATEVGGTASGSTRGYPIINQALTSYINDVKVFLSNSEAQEVLEKMQVEQDSLYKKRRQEVETVYQNNYVGTELRSKSDDLLALTQEQNSKQKQLDQKKKKQEAKAEKRILKEMGKIEAMKDFLVVDGKSTAEKYKADISLKTSKGKDTGYISPSAVLKIVLLVSQISWEREWWIEALNFEQERNLGKKILKISEIAGITPSFYWLKKIGSIIMLGLTILFMIVIACAVLIQYVMGIIEYVIISSVAVILIPMMLFDGTKDMANKILPSLFAQAIKLTFVVLCMVWIIISFLQIGENLLRDTSGFSFIQFAYIVFQLILIFAISSNAPKLAQTLLTGQPQMSMGEFMAAAGGALAIGKAVEKTGAVGARVGAMGINGGVSAVAGAGRAIKQGRAAYAEAIKNGGDIKTSLKSGFQAAGSSVGRDVAVGASNMINNLASGKEYTLSSLIRGQNMPLPSSNVSYTGTDDKGQSETQHEYLKRNLT